MSQELTKIKSRIKSVKSTLKVTSAMKLVSTVKLKRWKNKMLSGRDYSNEIDLLTNLILSNAENIETPFTKTNEHANKNLYIIVSSTLGLCGSYNLNIFKLADVSIKDEDDAIILGGKGLAHFKDGVFTKIEDFSPYSSANDSKTITAITNYVVNEYIKGIYREIHLIYSEYKNSMVFQPRDFKILPVKSSDNGVLIPPIMEPTPKKLVNEIIPLYLKTTINSKLLESEVCEQAARCNAMENATDNANELLNNLSIEFNKARQAAITQEITEIVGAAEAL
ncbi:MAG: ATP synthase F1 subunit gamma [Bacilli bacterium]|nr:ATP synthase F1 subunit gamma [Bacilli bacterium]